MYYIKDSVNTLEKANSKKAIQNNFQKASENYNKAIEYYKSDEIGCCPDLTSAKGYHEEAILGFYSGNKEDADLIKSFEAASQDRINAKKERNRALSRIEQKKKPQENSVSTVIKINDNKKKRLTSFSATEKVLIGFSALFTIAFAVSLAAWCTDKFPHDKKGNAILLGVRIVTVGLIALSVFCFCYRNKSEISSNIQNNGVPEKLAAEEKVMVIK